MTTDTRYEQLQRADGSWREVGTDWYEAKFKVPARRKSDDFGFGVFGKRWVRVGSDYVSVSVRAISFFAARAEVRRSTGLEWCELEWLDHEGRDTQAKVASRESVSGALHSAAR